MKRLPVAAVLAAVLLAPALSRAETPSNPAEAATPAPGAQPCPAADENSPAPDPEACDYAAREAAAPQLAEFSGGADGVYIGAGALVAIAVIILLIAVL
jgi:hypothetical protein